jgi:hypothetical protein
VQSKDNLRIELFFDYALQVDGRTGARNGVNNVCSAYERPHCQRVSPAAEVYGTDHTIGGDQERRKGDMNIVVAENDCDLWRRADALIITSSVTTSGVLSVQHP